MNYEHISFPSFCKCASIAYEIYLFQKFKKIGYRFETYGLIGHLENRVKVI